MASGTIGPPDPADPTGGGRHIGTGRTHERPLRTGAQTLEALSFTARRLLATPPWQDWIGDVLKRLGEATDVSRIYIFENHPDGDGALVTTRRYEWVAPGTKPQLDDPTTQGFALEGAGWGGRAEAFRRGDAFAVTTRELPPAQRAYLEAREIAAVASAPIVVNGKAWGFIGIDECRTERRWHPSELRTLEAAAAVLGSAIERHRVGRQVLEAEARYRALVEQIPAMTFTDEVGGPEEGVYVSPRIYDLLGFEPQDWYAEPDFWRHHIHPEDEPEVWAAWRRSVEEGGIFSREYRMLARDGSVVWVSERTTILPDESGRPRWIQGLLTDISERRDAEGRFRAVFEASPIGIVLVGKDFRFLDANSAFCRLLRYTRDQVRRLTFVDITHPEDVAIDAQLARQVFAGEIPSYSLEKRYLTSEGMTVWVHLTASVVRHESEGSAYGIGMVQDITERKRREAETLKAAAEARETLAGLTRREREVLDLMAAEGLTARQVAAAFHISARTAESHLASVYRKLRVASKESAFNEYRRLTALAAQPPNVYPISGTRTS